MIRYFVVFFMLFTLSAYTCENSENLIKRMEESINGKSATSEITMNITTPRWKRTVRILSESIENKKAYIRILYPKRDEGVSFLKIENDMWQYVPKIRKVIKIPPSLMLSSWMGSDFTNDDLVKESSLSEDYTASLVTDRKTCIYDLIPHETAPVVWGKIVIAIDEKRIVPLSAEYFDDDMILARKLEYSDIREVDGRFYPFRWTMTPLTEDKLGNRTEIIVDSITFDKALNEDRFTIKRMMSGR